MQRFDLPNHFERRISRKIFCYFLIDYLIAVFACLIAFLVLFLIAALIDDLSDFVQHQASMTDTIRYFLLVQPEHITNAAPMSLLMALMYVIGNYCRNNEITALRASGISIVQSSSPFWMVSVLFAGVHWMTTELLAPYGRMESEQIRERIQDPYHKREKKGDSYLAFRNKDGRRDWFFESFQVRGQCQSVRITQYRHDGTIDWELNSDTAVFDSGQWRFENVMMRRFDADGYLMVDEPEHVNALVLAELNENPESFIFLFRLRPLEELSALRIHKLLTAENSDFSETTRAVLKTYLSYYMCSPLTCLIAVVLGLPLALTHERGNLTRNFIIATAIMVMYYLMAQFFVVLGKNQTIPPVIAGALPTLSLIGWGIWELRKTA